MFSSINLQGCLSIAEMVHSEEESVGQVCHTPWLETFHDGLSYGESPPKSMPLLLSEFTENKDEFEDIDSFKKNSLALEDSWKLPVDNEKDWESHPEYPMGLWVGWFIPKNIHSISKYGHRYSRYGGPLCVDTFTAPPINNAIIQKAFKVVYRLGSDFTLELYALYSPNADGLCKAKLVPGGAANVFFFKEWRDDTVCGRYNRIATWMNKAEAGARKASLARRTALEPSSWYSRNLTGSDKHDDIGSRKEESAPIVGLLPPSTLHQAPEKSRGELVRQDSYSSSDGWLPDESDMNNDSSDSEPPTAIRHYRKKSNSTRDYSTPNTRYSRRHSYESVQGYSHSHSKTSPALPRRLTRSQRVHRESRGSPQSRHASRRSPQALSWRGLDDDALSPPIRQPNLGHLQRDSSITHNSSPQKRKKTRTNPYGRSQTEPPRKQHRPGQARQTLLDRSDSLQSEITFLAKDEVVENSDDEVQFVKEVPAKRDQKKFGDTEVANRTNALSDSKSVRFVEEFISAGKLTLFARLPDAFSRCIMLETFRKHLTST
ncbi:hypothetical protein BDP81DRAFT_455811 [Colletotrichum phormii]|uniref:Uncharacterized protein n=1 Tax=Colletotrichum phormii TaxID=359342 RepID=A0AAI9ZCF4_9PEZI|nr:uncharacterized protein BDP81DRAFT_455811 [Colletotrichum phormii]KAK1621972.1 hypothetical protein BDP81DRAFT_455811 [Colletotrichum phormii]